MCIVDLKSRSTWNLGIPRNSMLPMPPGSEVIACPMRRDNVKLLVKTMGRCPEVHPKTVPDLLFSAGNPCIQQLMATTVFSLDVGYGIHKTCNVSSNN